MSNSSEIIDENRMKIILQQALFTSMSLVLPAHKLSFVLPKNHQIS